jgi:hypothetical protein
VSNAADMLKDIPKAWWSYGFSVTDDGTKPIPQERARLRIDDPESGGTRLAQ